MAKVIVGAVQAEPGWLDLKISVKKTIALIEEASRKGVQLLGLPEVWKPGEYSKKLTHCMKGVVLSNGLKQVIRGAFGTSAR